MPEKLNNKVVSATKWSVVAEFATKMVTPISTMILARLLTPDAFGVLVTVTMVISFAEVFTDAGFQKYLIQHEFKNADELERCTCVAFWTNLIFSLFFWLIITLFSSQIAHLVGNDGHGLVIAISCVCIPLEAFSSIQMALFKRKMDFKSLFYVRLIGAIIPLIVTVPLAFATRSYWSLVIGMIALNMSNAVLLTYKSSWKPRFFYSLKLFKQMFSFTMWSMMEAVSIWLTGYVDIFIVGTILSSYYMGVYRTSMAIVGQIMGLITAATTPVLFSALSRLQNDGVEFKRLFFKFQKLVGILVVPLGVGIYLFHDLVTDIILGSQWKEAAYFIGWWGLTSAITIVLAHYCSEVFRAKGRPKLSVLAQWVYMAFLIPTVLIAVHYSFDILALSRSLVRLGSIICNLLILYYLVQISPISMLKNVCHIIFAAITMIAVVKLLPSTISLWVQSLYIMIASITYFVVLCSFDEERVMLFNLRKILNLK